MSVRNVKKEKLESFLASRRYMDEPLIPTEKDDGAKGPMEEGMWYIIFDSSGDGELDTAVRYFWVNAPFANITVNDLFLVSEHLENRRFSKIYGSSKIIKNAPDKAYIVGKADKPDSYNDLSLHNSKIPCRFSLNYLKLLAALTRDYSSCDPRILTMVNQRIALEPDMHIR